MTLPTPVAMAMEDAPRPQVTIRSLARQLNVSATTVSYALSNHPNVSKKVRARVLALADELGYRPDPAIRAIASQHWNGASPKTHHTIAYLTHAPYGPGQAQDPFMKFAEVRAADFGYELKNIYVDGMKDGAEVSEYLLSEGIRGLLIPQIRNPLSTHLMEIDWSRFTAVCCAVGRVRPPLHTVTGDVFAEAQQVWERVLPMGFRNIGVTLHRHVPFAEDDWSRIGASRAALELSGIPREGRIPLLLADVSDKRKLADWYFRHKPDIVIGFTNATGEALEELGVRMPEDTRFVCLMTAPGSKWSGFVRQDEVIAHQAVELLADEIRRNQWGLPDIPKFVLIRPTWNQGSTLGSAL